MGHVLSCPPAPSAERLRRLRRLRHGPRERVGSAAKTTGDWLQGKVTMVGCRGPILRQSEPSIALVQQLRLRSATESYHWSCCMLTQRSVLHLRLPSTPGEHVFLSFCNPGCLHAQYQSPVLLVLLRQGKGGGSPKTRLQLDWGSDFWRGSYSICGLSLAWASNTARALGVASSALRLCTPSAS